MRKRVVITGLGVCSPNGIGIENFTKALQDGTSGIRFDKQLEELKFGCQIAAEPQLSDDLISQYFTPLQLRGLNASGILYGVIAGTDAWTDATLSVSEKETPDWDSGIIFGTGILGVDKLRKSIHLVDAKNVRPILAVS